MSIRLPDNLIKRPEGRFVFMPDKPLQDAIENLLKSAPQGMSEYALFKQLQALPEAFFAETDFADPSSLFPSHFLLFHCLYMLQQQWHRSQKGWLSIDPRCIQLHPPRTGSTQLSSGDSLADYYLDLTNLDKDANQIDDLLDDFWQRMSKYLVVTEATDIADAFAAFALSPDCSLDELRKQYRLRLHQSHPDKGGCLEQTQALNQAYQTAYQYLKRQ